MVTSTQKYISGITVAKLSTQELGNTKTQPMQVEQRRNKGKNQVGYCRC